MVKGELLTFSEQYFFAVIYIFQNLLYNNKEITIEGVYDVTF